MYAVIETGGKQYRVELGMEIEIDRLEAAPGETIELGRVLLLADGEEAQIGQPVVDGAKVSAFVVGQDRGDKIVVFKYRPKARRRVKRGHRQDLTLVRVSDIVFNGRSAAKEAEAQAREEEAARQAAAEEAARKAAADRELAAKLEREAKAAEEARAAEAKKAEAKPAGTRKRAKKAATDEAEEPDAGKAETVEPEPEAAESEAEGTDSEAEGTDSEAEGTDSEAEGTGSKTKAKPTRRRKSTDTTTEPKRSRTKKDE